VKRGPELRVSEDLALPCEAVTQTFAIVAKRGVGKTYTAKVMVEEMIGAGLHVVVLDPIGVWYGLGAAANGKDPGLPVVVMGGDHGHVPLAVDAGKLIAEFVVENAQPVVIDLSHFRKAEQDRFVTAFAETLYRKNRAPLHLVLDEADAFAPQRPMPGQQAMLGAIEDLVRRGRARGLGLTLITQRAAVLNKNVLTQIEVLVALRTIAPQDREAIDAWIQVHGTPEQRRELMESLPSLPIGTAWFWSPGWLDVFRRARIRKAQTFDSSSTPKAGEQRPGPKKLAEVDLDALRERIAATIEQAKANDPRELRRRVADLEKQLAERAAPATVTQTVEVPVLEDGDLSRIEDLADRARAVVDSLRGTADEFAEIARGLVEAIGRARSPGPVLPPPTKALTRPFLGRIPARPTTTPGNPEVGSGGLRRILIALAQRPQGLSTRQLGMRAGLSSSGGTFATYLSRGRTAGWIAGPPGRLEITHDGLAALGTFDPLPTGDALLAYWRDQLGGGAGRMLTALYNAFPQGMSRTDLAQASGVTASGGTFATYLSRLTTLELIARADDGLRASDEFFS
jgi:hypothetical protein